MGQRSTLMRLTAAVCATFLVACSGADATAPTEDHPPIPQMSYSFDNCAVWSCSSGQCAQDPTVWGACCIQTTDQGETGAPRPSCEAPPGGSHSPDWCSDGEANFQVQCIQRKSEDLTFHDDCYGAPYSDPVTHAANFGETRDIWDACNVACPSCHDTPP